MIITSPFRDYSLQQKVINLLKSISDPLSTFPWPRAIPRFNDRRNAAWSESRPMTSLRVRIVIRGYTTHLSLAYGFDNIVEQSPNVSACMPPTKNSLFCCCCHCQKTMRLCERCIYRGDSFEVNEH